MKGGDSLTEAAPMFTSIKLGDVTEISRFVKLAIAPISDGRCNLVGPEGTLSFVQPGNMK